MKIKSVTIEGMHNVASKTYNLKDVTYFVGKNGAGKSTVLQAIQLALLGYIPGYPKTSEGVFKHAKGKTMSVTLVLDDNGKDVTVSRSWIAAGSSSKNVVSIEPNMDLAAITKDIELPIFNFNDFSNLTANKLKEWFIAFLPNAAGEIDWSSELRSAAEGKYTLDENVLAEVVDVIGTFSETGVELVKKVNAYLKECQTMTKGQLASIQGAIDSLVYYDDDELIEDPEELSSKITELNNLRRSLAQYTTALASRERIQAQLDAIVVSGTDATSDPDIHAAEKTIIDADAEIQELGQAIESLRSELLEVNAEISANSMLASGSGVCPYTKVACESVAPLIQEASSKVKQAQARGNEINQKIQKTTSLMQVASNKKNSASFKIREIQGIYSKIDFLKSQLTDLPERPTEMTDEEIVEEVSRLTTKLNHAVANAKYNSLIEEMTTKKYGFENSMELYKIWAKHTDANGMQTTMMNGPFEKLAKEMSKYLSQMFNASTSAKFNLSEKANSFSFGLVRDDKYISFDTLSSGEKCLYTLALMMCITNKTSSPLKLIIVDDLLDHLDVDNAEYLFKSLLNLKDIQIILAGVQPCKLKSLMVEV